MAGADEQESVGRSASRCLGLLTPIVPINVHRLLQEWSNLEFYMSYSLNSLTGLYRVSYLEVMNTRSLDYSLHHLKSVR